MSAEQRQLLDPGPAAPKKRQRRERDAYYTPGWAIDTFVERVPEACGETLLDPCCGDARMALRLAEAGRFSEIYLNDIDPTTAAPTHLDACDESLWYLPGSGEGPEWSVTNPPWEGSGQIAWTALQHARRGVALLLRITWLEPCAGREWLRRLPPTRMITLPRICYDGSGQTDSATSAWFIWERDPVTGLYKRGGIEVAGGDVGQLGLEVAGVR